MNDHSYRVGLIGTGNMGKAMLGAWIESGLLASEQIIAAERVSETLAAVAAERGIATGGAEDTAAAQVVVLAVKPQDSGQALSALAGRLDSSQVVLSIAAGLTISSIRDQVGEGPAIVRVMPNMGALVGAAISAFAVDESGAAIDRGFVTGLLESIGEVVEVDERWMDLVTAVSGSGPAYFFYLAEALENAAVEQGMDPEVASSLARETLWGAAKTVKETGRDPADLRKAVSSPGGTTLAALASMDEAGFVRIISEAVDAARRRAGELAR